MRSVERPALEIQRRHRTLVERIVAITSRRRRLTEHEHRELSRFVESELRGGETYGLGPFRGRSSVASYLSVVVQRLYRELTGKGPRPEPAPTPLEDAIRRTSSKLSSREALVLKMWFQSGMTTQKIATVMGMRPRDVHAVVATQTGDVQQTLAESHPPSTDD